MQCRGAKHGHEHISSLKAGIDEMLVVGISVSSKLMGPDHTLNHFKKHDARLDLLSETIALLKDIVKLRLGMQCP